MWQIPPLPQAVPSLVSLQADALTLGWQPWQAFVGFLVPDAYVAAPIKQPAPEPPLELPPPVDAEPLLDPELLDPELLLDPGLGLGPELLPELPDPELLLELLTPELVLAPELPLEPDGPADPELLPPLDATPELPPSPADADPERVGFPLLVPGPELFPPPLLDPGPELLTLPLDPEAEPPKLPTLDPELLTLPSLSAAVEWSLMPRIDSHPRPACASTPKAPMTTKTRITKLQSLQFFRAPDPPARWSPPPTAMAR